MWLGFGIWLAEVPLYFSLALLASVLLRVPFHAARRRADRDENGRRALLERAYRSAGERELVRIEAFEHAWRKATQSEIDRSQLEALLLELGGDLVINENGGTAWHFPTIELELAALARVRAELGTSEREVGEVEFTSLPADEHDALPEGRGASSSR